MGAGANTCGAGNDFDLGRGAREFAQAHSKSRNFDRRYAPRCQHDYSRVRRAHGEANFHRGGRCAAAPPGREPSKQPHTMCEQQPGPPTHPASIRLPRPPTPRAEPVLEEQKQRTHEREAGDAPAASDAKGSWHCTQQDR